MEPSKKIRSYLLVFVFISLVCGLAYSNTLHNPFLWDDEALVVKNTLIRGWEKLPEVFSHDLYFGSNFGSNFYRPLQTLTYILDYHFWQLNPFGYHLTNILLQIAVSFLAFILIARLFASFTIGIAASILFSVTPLHTEAVTYISGRAEMLMGFFIILSLLLFIRSQSASVKNKGWIYTLSIFSFACALFSKELAVVFPLVIIGYLVYSRSEKDKEKLYCLRPCLPYVVIAFIYILARITFLHFPTLAPPGLVKFPWFIRVSVLPQVVLTYCRLLIFPTGLHMSWELARPKSFVGILFAVTLLGLIFTFSYYYLKQLSRKSTAAFMFLWALVFFIPQSGILPINAFIAEHFIYLPSLSFFALLAVFLHKFLSRRLFIFCVSLICAFYIMLTGLRNREWSVPVVFYQNIIRYSPTSFQAHNNLGLEYERMGAYKEAEKEYLSALKIKEDLLEAHSNLASVYYKQKKYTQALAEYLIVEKMPLGEKAGEVENNIANIYDLQGLKDKALEKYKLALELDPRLDFAHFNLARIYFAQNNRSEAAREIYYSLFSEQPDMRKDYLKIISDFINTPGSASAGKEFYNNLGIAFVGSSFWQPAIICFRRTLELEANFTDGYFNLGLAYLKNGQNKEAISALQSCLRIDPNHFKAKGLLTSIKRKN